LPSLTSDWGVGQVSVTAFIRTYESLKPQLERASVRKSGVKACAEQPV
jgi:hypothetical protein